MFSRKKRVHKQSKYFTLMLVPYSSNKVKSIKIPHWSIYSFFGMIIILAASSLVFSSKNVALQDSVTSISTDLYESNKLNDELSQDKDKLREAIEEEKSKSLQNIQKQREDYESNLDYYEDRLLDFESQIEELEKIKEEIYDQLSKVELPDYISNQLLAFDESLVDLRSIALLSSVDEGDKIAVLDYKISELDEKLYKEILEFENLINNVQTIKPYLDAFPTGWPVHGRITSGVGSRANPFTGLGAESHSGLDIAVATGNPIKVTGAGKVTFAGWQNGYGNFVEIDHGYGIKTRYGHNSELLVSVGDYVSRGDVIAKSGNTGRSTGPHLHYEVLLNGVYQNPLNYLE